MPDDELGYLVEAAKQASGKAYAPYSRFCVGAAVAAEDGEVFTGCNVENASYGLSMCAERVALFNALAAGTKKITALAIYTDSPKPTSPCGACRQVIHELAPGARVVIANSQGIYAIKGEEELLPLGFDASALIHE